MHFGGPQMMQWAQEQAWEDCQAPLHVTPQSMQSLDKQKMGSEPLQAPATAGGYSGHGSLCHLLEPRHVGIGLSAEATHVPMPEAFPSGGTSWEMPMFLPQGHLQEQGLGLSSWPGKSANMAPAPVPAAATQHQQEEHKQHMAQMAQTLRFITAQHGLPPDGEYFAQTVAEIEKRLPGFSSSVGWEGATKEAVGQLPQNLALVEEVPEKRSAEEQKRVDELNKYIRQQAHEFIEGQAEWSRQIAEVRSECLREVEKVRREKEELERQARQELLRLQYRIKELGGGEETVSFGTGCQASQDSEQTSAPWANVVSMDKFQAVRARCQAAEDRVKELQKYIKAHSGSDSPPHAEPEQQLKERDEQVKTLQKSLLSLGAELQQTASELHALRLHHQYKVLFWEQGAQQLLAMATEFFGQNGLRGMPLGGSSSNGGGGNGEEDTSQGNGGRFCKTATKVMVTLSPGGDKNGNDVKSLQHMLKDALKNGPKDKTLKRADKAATASSSTPSSPITSRESSPGRASSPGCDGEKASGSVITAGAALQVVRDNSLRQIPGSPAEAAGGTDEAAAMAETARVAHFMAQLAAGLRHLLTASQQAVAPPASPLPSTMATTGTTPGETGAGGSAQASGHSSNQVSLNESAAAMQVEKLRAIMEGLAPAKRCATQHIVAVERALRTMERELRGRCQELLGAEELVLEEAACEEVMAKTTLEESQRQLPLNSEAQLQSLYCVRHAQFRSSFALAEFVQLPQRLKTVFDITKQLSSEMEATCSLLAAGASVRLQPKGLQGTQSLVAAPA
eukprot:TRINITY_DN8496_c0_g2_i1.p1 TRINITY_DN8496_c0_g2~~TRINITY_DN8496_c0_g2_i1.p1  ORF type:complete len:793 (+),score=201.14 TRINITY_DN8496_c0_g2_i1:183-2561(+)